MTAVVKYKTTTKTNLVEAEGALETAGSVIELNGMTGGTNFVSFPASGNCGATVSADGMTADPETAQEAGYITVDINGTAYQIPIYAA